MFLVLSSYIREVKKNYGEFQGAKYFIDSWKMVRLMSELLTAPWSRAERSWTRGGTEAHSYMIC